MPTVLDAAALNRLFLSARSVHTFTNQPVTDETLEKLYGLLKWGPTAFNSQPGRYVFVRSAAAKARLAPAMSAGNRDKTLAAPVTAIVAYDHRFFDRLIEPNPKVPELYAKNEALAQVTAFRNGTLQGAYLLLAARALGLDVGPMSGFDANAVEREFFPGGRHRANFLVNMGYANDSVPRPRGPRFAFGDVVQVL
jgi:3-hydroxypropanoate dehydrogenase